MEQAAQIALHRDELFVLDREIGQLGVCRNHVGLLLRELLDVEDALTGDDAAQRAVGNLEHLLNHADRADALNVVRARILDLAILEHGQTDRLAFAQRFFDERNARLLDDGQRNDGVREKHRFLQRQNADQVCGYDLFGFAFSHVLS